jgi:hypothetical protein
MVGGYQYCGETYYILLRRLKQWYEPNRLHCVINSRAQYKTGMRLYFFRRYTNVDGNILGQQQTLN